MNKYMKITFFSLGTINTINIFEQNKKGALDSACKRVFDIDDKMSAFKENSDVMRINHFAGIKSEKISSDTFKVLQRALKFSRLSNGNFDITVHPLTSLWKIGKDQDFIPEVHKINENLKLVNYNDLYLDKENTRAYLKNSGQSIDLGSIAKGYAADEVKKILLQNNIKNALINLGGNILAIGNNISGKPWCIGIQNPLAPRGNYIGTVKISNKTVVTSGSNERFFIKNGIRYHHIINPNTGYPARNKILSVTVIGEESMDADAISTALFIGDIQKSTNLLKSIKAEAIFIMEDKNIFTTKGLINNFERSY